MTEYEKMVSGLPYDATDGALLALRLAARRRIAAYNRSEIEDVATPTPPQRLRMLEEIFQKPLGNVVIEPTLRVDYGVNTVIEGDFFANFGLVILDCAPVHIGHRCLFGPNVQLLTPVHPLDPVRRAAWEESAKPIRIGENVWLGGGVIVLPGVTVGKGAVVGAGSVVTKDVPPYVVAAGSPCRVVRDIAH